VSQSLWESAMISTTQSTTTTRALLRRHFHLSEFCRYAIESKAFPQLSANLSSGLNRGYYTWDEINTLVSQAKERGIRVIPE
jgi:N-acetyl-beta-hexosaminidase